MKSRRSLGSAIAVDTVVKQSNKRRKSVDAKLINDKDNHCDKNNDDDDDNNNNKVKENKENEDKNNKKYMLRSPGLKKARHSLGITAAPSSFESMRDMDESMIEKKGGHDQRSRRTTANPNDLFDLLHDLADASCLSINSEDIYEKPSNNHPPHAAASSEQQQTAADESTRSEMQMNSSINKNKGTNSKGVIKPKIMMITRRKTFDGVITDSFLKENDDIDDDISSEDDAIEASAATKKLPDRRATLDPSELLLSVYHDVHMEHEHETGSLRK